jgi:hypothetical protein
MESLVYRSVSVAVVFLVEFFVLWFSHYVGRTDRPLFVSDVWIVSIMAAALVFFLARMVGLSMAGRLIAGGLTGVITSGLIHDGYYIGQKPHPELGIFHGAISIYGWAALLVVVLALLVFPAITAHIDEPKSKPPPK